MKRTKKEYFCGVDGLFEEYYGRRSFVEGSDEVNVGG